ncbi:hypothetical protein LXL04_009332 [Taraxacum kok-saghyz]
MIVDENSIRITDKLLSDADASSIRWIKLKKSKCNGCVEFWKVHFCGSVRDPVPTRTPHIRRQT